MKTENILGFTAICTAAFIAICTAIVRSDVERLRNEIAVFTKTTTSSASLAFVSDDEVRHLDGRLVADQKNNIMHFRALTPAKPPSGERFSVPIAGGMSNIIAAVQSTTAAMGANYTPLSIVPEIGVYEGKLALMGAVVTITFPPQK